MIEQDLKVLCIFLNAVNFNHIRPVCVHLHAFAGWRGGEIANNQPDPRSGTIGRHGRTRIAGGHRHACGDALVSELGEFLN